MIAGLFVYGTLLSRARMDAVLGEAARWRVVAPAVVGGVLYDRGAYPGMVLCPGAVSMVPGLLVEIDPEGAALARLDAYEGVGEGLFARRRIALARRPAEHRTAWLYEYRGPVEGLSALREWQLGPEPT